MRLRPLGLQGLTAVALFLSSACAAAAPGKNVAAALDQPVVLAPGQLAAIAGAPVAVRLLGIPTDSRCPSGAQCGEVGSVAASVQVELAGKAGSPATLTLAESEKPPGLEVGDYTVKLTKVEPWPSVQSKARAADYRATIVVSRRAPAVTPQSQAQAPSASSLAGHIAAGKPVVVTFDGLPATPDDVRVPLGTVKGGERYTVRWDPQQEQWTATGYNKGTRGVGSWTYPQGRPEKYELDIWGRVFRFDEQGVLTDREVGKVGHVARAEQ